ncbi:MAG: carbohydrate ABC transporter permease, partial [Mycetocola reblochoni]
MTVIKPGRAPESALLPPATGAPVPRPKKRRGSRSRRGVSGWVVLVVMAVCALLMLFPFWLALINAFKPAEEYLQTGPTSLPTTLDFSALVAFWQSVDFNQKLVNSVVISGSVALIAAAISLVSAFAIGIGRVKGRVWILAIFMLAFTIPQEALVYPLFILTRELGLYDTQL